MSISHDTNVMLLFNFYHIYAFCHFFLYRFVCSFFYVRFFVSLDVNELQRIMVSMFRKAVCWLVVMMKQRQICTIYSTWQWLWKWVEKCRPKIVIIELNTNEQQTIQYGKLREKRSSNTRLRVKSHKLPWQIHWLNVHVNELILLF